MTTLRLLIDSRWPQEHLDCPWFLCDGTRLLGQGRSAPRHWPGMENAPEARPRVELLLQGAQVAVHQVLLPRGTAASRAEVLAAALEERLLDDPAQCQFLLLTRQEDGQGQVAVISRARLEGLLGLLGELGLEVEAAWPAGALLPPAGTGTEPRRSARWDGDTLLLAQAGGYREYPREWLALLAADSQPTLLRHGGQPPPGPLPPAWELEAEQGCPFQPAPGPGLLHGDYSPRSSSHLPGHHYRFLKKPLLALAAASCCLVLLQWGLFSWQAGQLQAQIRSHFRQTFPQAVLVDPLLQLQRQLDARRQARGMLGERDFLPLLQALSQHPGLELQQLDYLDGRLEARARLPAAGLEVLQARLGAAGLRLRLQEQERQGETLALKLDITPGSAP